MSYAGIVFGAMAEWAKSKPHAPALIDPNGVKLDYGELWSRMTAVGRKLEHAGIESRDRVAVLLPQGVSQVLTVMGTLNHCVCAPLQPRTNAIEVTAALAKMAATALIAAPEFEAEARSALASGLTVLMASQDQGAGEWEICRSNVSPRPPVTSSDAVLLLVTSATTTASKLVPLAVSNLDAEAQARRDSLRLTAADRMLLMTSLSHKIGIGNTLAQFLAGGAVIPTSGFDPAAYLRWLRDLRPTWYDCAPAVHQAAWTRLKSDPPELPTSLRLVQSAGAPLPDDVRNGLEELLQVPVFNDYGMSEASPIAIDAFLQNGRVPNSAGRSCGMQIGIMDASGEILSAGQDGEIVVRGPAVFGGYEGDDEANRRAFLNDWFRTGDTGRLDGDGNLYVTGRLKEMINRGGEKILPREVDSALSSHPDVREAVAFAVPHRTLGEDVACAVVLRDGANVSAADLRRYAAQSLASFKVPHRIYIVEEIPRGELGKPQRWMLTEQFKQQSTTPSPAETWDPGLPYVVNDLRYKIREIWARILDRDDVSLAEDFFQAGGDSLGAITMLAEIDQRLGSNTSDHAAEFLDEPTIEHLTTLVGMPVFPRSAYGASSHMQLYPICSKNSAARLYLAPADEDEGLYFRRLARHLEGIMDVTVVRPANTFYSRSLYTFESAAEEMTRLVLQEQADGPYILGGYCFGGVIALEAARQLALLNREVRLLLFDVPMPGYPGLARYPSSGFRNPLRRPRPPLDEQPVKPDTITNPGEGDDAPHGKAPITIGSRMRRIAGSRSRMLLWHAIAQARPLIRPLEKFNLTQRLLEIATEKYFPIYRARPIHVPIFHFLCADEPDAVLAESRLGWRKVARGGIKEQSIPHDHMNALHESSLPAIVDAVRTWCRI